MAISFTSCIIPDDQLEAYLADKLTTKPDYGYSTEAATSITSREVAAREADEKNRKANNKRANPKRY
jgi:hypothetical protein